MAISSRSIAAPDQVTIKRALLSVFDKSGLLDLAKALADNGALIAKGAYIAPKLGGEREACPHGCDRALEYAVITAPEARDPALVAKLDAVAGRVLA